MLARPTSQELAVESNRPQIAVVSPATTLARIDPRAASCIAARREFIHLHKDSQLLGDVEWRSTTWDVTVALQQTLKGYKSRKKSLVSFTRHRQPGQRLGSPFPEDNELADAIKAFACRRHALKPVTALRHMVYIRAWRYLVAAMRGTDIAELTPSNFNSAAQAATKEKASSAYTIHGALETIADTLDELHLVKVRLRWKWTKKRTRHHGGAKQRRTSDSVETDRRASDEVVYAIAQLYRTVPNSAWADRICVLLATILVCTGLRLGQALCLRAEMPLLDEETGEYYLRLVAFKRSDATRKTLLTETVELLNDVFHELLELTKPCREVACWLAKNPGKVNLPAPDLPNNTLSVAKLGQWLGLTGNALKYRLKSWGVLGDRVSIPDLNERLLDQRFDAPIVPSSGGETLLLEDSLLISFFSGMRRSTTALPHVVQPVNEQHVSDCLRGRRLKGGRSNPNIFERYALTDAKGTPLSVRSHAFRHKLNDALDAGGAPDVIQAQWFTRVNPRDNSAYQYRNPGEMRERARELLVDGQLIGRYSNLLNEVGPAVRTDVAASMVQVAHPTMGGYCLQSFAQVDCENCGQCLDDCNSFHWRRGEVERESELVIARDGIARKLRVMLDCMSDADKTNEVSLDRQLNQLALVNSILDSIRERASDTESEK